MGHNEIIKDYLFSYLPTKTLQAFRTRGTRKFPFPFVSFSNSRPAGLSSQQPSHSLTARIDANHRLQETHQPFQILFFSSNRPASCRSLS